MNPRVAVVLVTHDSLDFLPQTLQSIAEQTQQADTYIAIDDLSTDATVELLRSSAFAVYRATSPGPDLVTRIAHNFHQGLRIAEQKSADIVLLGDHDDIWHRDRIAHQVAMLEANPQAAMLASDGFLIDEHGAALPGTIRGSFPIPGDFASWPRHRQVAYALRHSLATGGACAVRISCLDRWDVPPGWLHDRWWSLRALSADRLVIDATAVIDYRVFADQQVGLDNASQDSRSRWWWGKVRQAPASGRKARDVASLLRG